MLIKLVLDAAGGKSSKTIQHGVDMEYEFHTIVLGVVLDWIIL